MARSDAYAPAALPELGPAAPTAPIALSGEAAAASARLSQPRVEVPDPVLDQLRSACASVTTDRATTAEASRDWWPLAMTWALDGHVAGLAAAVARPDSADQVPPILRICNEAGIPVTAAAGRSGVCGSSVPLYGGVVLDLCDLTGIVDVDDASLTVDVRAGTFGDHFEHELRTTHGLTCGHWPQSVTLSTVGGWLACRGAGQLSTRYGKIEDMVVGLDVVLADGTVIATGGNPRQSSGPDLNQLFVGSEGTLGIITGARLRVHPAPTHERRLAVGFETFADGLEVCRRILRRGATPAVLRLYDATEADRNYQTGALAVLLVLDEGEPNLVDAAVEIVEEECEIGLPLDVDLVERWMGHRNDVSALEKLIGGGLVVDTMEVTGSWRSLPAMHTDTIAAIQAVPGTLAASAHQSHAYPEGACLYFTFAGKPDGAAKDAYYRAVWDAGTRAVLAHGGSLSHHHGVGINRGRFMREALGAAHGTLGAVKAALDPKGILNPGKLGFDSPFGPNPFADPGLDAVTGPDDGDPGTDGADATGGRRDPGELDLRSIGLGALVALAIVVPCGLVIRGAGTGSAGLLFLGVVIGFGLGGAVAGRTSRTRYLTQGAASGLVAVTAYIAIGLLDHVASGRSIRVVALVFTALLGTCCGMLGASIGDRRQRRPDAASHPEGET